MEVFFKCEIKKFQVVTAQQLKVGNDAVHKPGVVHPAVKKLQRGYVEVITYLKQSSQGRGSPA